MLIINLSWGNIYFIFNWTLAEEWKKLYCRQLFEKRATNVRVCFIPSIYLGFWRPVVKMDKIENSLEWLQLNHFVRVKFTLEVSILSQKERTNIYISNHNYSPTSSQKKLSIFLARSLTFLFASRSSCPYHQFKSVHKLHHHHHQRWRSWWKEKSNMNSIHVVSFLLWTKKLSSSLSHSKPSLFSLYNYIIMYIRVYHWLTLSLTHKYSSHSSYLSTTNLLLMDLTRLV